ncbi:ABC transporter substrate-binding protein [Cohnella sp. 56]|uniref:ABC transporter substrate-binding protein n=1 Tax=Cohnella sp. 56 TaxID=3113722 RepID=UPI0030E89613
MQRIRSLTICILFTVLFAALLSACAGGRDNAEGSAAPTQSQSQSQSPPAAASGAEADPQEAKPKTVVDDAGHQVVVPAHPQRIVAPYLEDPLAVLGLKPVAQVLYGNVEQNYLKDELAGAEIIDTTGGGLPLEKLVELSPDLIVLGKGMAGDGAYEQYAKIAPTFVVDNLTKSWRETLLTMAGLLGREQAAADRLEAYDRQVEQAKGQLREAVGDGTAAVIVLSEKEFYTMGHIQGGRMLFDELGVKPHSLTPDKDEWNTLSMEKLPELDADYLFVIKTERYQASALESNSLWKGLPAVKQGHVLEVESGIWQYSGLICNERVLADIVGAIVG